MRLRGKSLRRIAKSIGITPVAVSAALGIPSFRAEQAIAEALGLTPQQLFPERYDGAGNRLHLVKPQSVKNTPVGLDGERQKGAAA